MDFGMLFALKIVVATIQVMLMLLQIALQIAEKLLLLSVKLRLEFCLIYGVVVAIGFRGWALEHTTLALGILIAIAVATLISWIFTLVLKIQQWRMKLRMDGI